MLKNKFILISIILSLSILLYGLKMSFAKPQDLMDSIIVIDPGHGGKDNGAAHLDLIEDELNLKISKLLYVK